MHTWQIIANTVTFMKYIIANMILVTERISAFFDTITVVLLPLDTVILWSKGIYIPRILHSGLQDVDF